MTVVLVFIFACAVALLGFASKLARAGRLSPPSTFAGILVGLAISFIGLRPWITQFGAPLSIEPFIVLIAAAASWAVIRNQVRITRHHVWWLLLLAIVFWLSFRAAVEIPQGAIVTAVAVLVTACLRVSAMGVMVGLLLAGYSLLAASIWFSTLDLGLRLSVLGENPIWIARVGVLGAIACLFLFATWRGRVLAALPLVAVVIYTGSRGPALSLLAGGLVFIVLNSRRPALPLTGIAVLAVATPLLAPISVANPVFGGPERLGSISVRLDTWRIAADVWLANPFIGTGEPVDPRLLAGLVYPHNSLVELLAQSGLIGLALVLVAAVSAVRRPAA
ncbi:O-antigen ligase family protein, partial [Aeromicrobium sp.]|uniref:O-antigen ligase family protein n=1 Tax=Aeromicrobium sp. TaxID=1871063 RepID=UPI003D6C4C43